MSGGGTASLLFTQLLIADIRIHSGYPTKDNEEGDDEDRESVIKYNSYVMMLFLSVAYFRAPTIYDDDNLYEKLIRYAELNTTVIVSLDLNDYMMRSHLLIPPSMTSPSALEPRPLLVSSAASARSMTNGSLNHALSDQ
jgi:hypothetical protein